LSGSASTGGVPCGAEPFDLVLLDLDGTLVQGTDGVLRGAREALVDLRQRGVRTGIASFCGRSFLERGLELLAPASVDAARCLDHPRCPDKRAMVADLCHELGSRSAVLIGDSPGDGAAARANGLPFVHFRGSGAPSLGAVAVAELWRWDELRALLDLRRQGLLRLWRELGEPRSLGLLGAGGAGVDLLARDLRRTLAAVGAAELRTVPAWGPATAAERGGAGPAPILWHGARAADPARAPERLVEVTVDPELAEQRLRAAFDLEGPAAVAAALARAEEERRRVAQALAERPADARWDGGDPLLRALHLAGPRPPPAAPPD
jgi:hypothetical protein